MVRCIDCGEEYHISDDWAFTFEDVDVTEKNTYLEEEGICSACYEKNKSAFVESLLTEEQLKKITLFEKQEFERFEKAVGRMEGCCGEEE